ncbi:MAG: hypothetical protein Q8M31_02040 [Beijerinckiaceae bacterium]|nr:hypothetical protein [Beijerinckiaceae bacterium]
MRQAAKRLDEALADAGARSLGEFLNLRIQAGEGARFRITGIGAKAGHQFYPSRGLIQTEFDSIWSSQAGFDPAVFSDEAKEQIREAMFHQRPLKAVRPGRCTFNPTEERLAAALPSVDARRIYQWLNELRYGEGFTRGNSAEHFGARSSR